MIYSLIRYSYPRVGNRIPALTIRNWVVIGAIPHPRESVSPRKKQTMLKTILAVILLSLATSANANYVGSYDVGGCNSGTVVCPQPKQTHFPDMGGASE